MFRHVFTLLTAALATDAGAQTSLPCAPTPAYLAVPPPVVVVDDLVERTETIEIASPLGTVLDVVNSTELEDAVAESDLPHVVGTRPLTEGAFGMEGTRRLVCLSDGSTVLEQVLVRDRTETAYHFRYVVWNYTTPQADAIDYGVGDFLITATSDTATRLEWSYGFKLKPGNFPGNLGPLGGPLFRLAFLDRAYANMMRATLEGYRASAETSNR
jgi:hypothetical protein